MWVFEEDTETYWKEVTPFWRKKKKHPKLMKSFAVVSYSGNENTRKLIGSSSVQAD